MFKIAVLLLWLVTSTLAKKVFCKSRFTTDKEGSDYCTRFSVGEDHTMEVKLQVRTVLRSKKGDTDKVSPGMTTTIQAAIFSDQHWDELQELIVNESIMATCEMKRELADKIIDIKLPLDGTNSDDFTQFEHIVSKDRPHMYYFKVLDCENQLRKQFGSDMPRIETTWEIRTKLSWNYEDDKWSEFSYEDSNQYSLYFWMWILIAAITCGVAYNYLQYYKVHEKLCTPHPFILAALACSTGSLFFECLNCSIYARDGMGVLALDVFAKIFVCIAEVLVSILLLMLASGWTLTYQDVDCDDSIDIYLPIGAVVVVLHIMLAALDYVDIDESHKYHDYAGLQGYFLIGVKMILLTCFLVQLRWTWSSIEQRTKPYFKMLAYLGCAFTCSVPLSIFTAWQVAPYSRQYIFTMFNWVIHAITLLVLYWQLSMKTSSYQKGNLDALGLLPLTGLPKRFD